MKKTLDVYKIRIKSLYVSRSIWWVFVGPLADLYILME